MGITMERSTEVGEHIKALVEAMNGIEEEDIRGLLEAVSEKETMGSLLDPTRYMRESDGDRQGRRFLLSLLEFKRGVSGIGNCR